MKFKVLPYNKKFVIAELCVNNAHWSSHRYFWAFVTDNYPRSEVENAKLFDSEDDANAWIKEVTNNSEKFIKDLLIFDK